MERHYYRCLDCLEVQTIDGPLLRGQWVNGTHEWPLCDCGGWLKWMGQVRGTMLGKMHLACACDGRCISALGGSCDCICGGRNHGTGRIVKVVTGLRGIPQIPPRADLQTRQAIVAEFKAAKLAAQERITARWGEGYANFKCGKRIEGQTYWEIRDAHEAYKKACGYLAHARRIKALGQIAAIAQMEAA